MKSIAILTLFSDIHKNFETISIIVRKHLELMFHDIHCDLQAYPPRDAGTISGNEETEPASHFSLDAARELLQSMRRTYTSGSGYYDRSLLEDGKQIPLRPVAPNEYSQVDPQSMLPSAGGPTMTLGDFLGADPAAYESAVSNNRQSSSAGYNPNTDGVSRTWSGGRDNFQSSSGETQIRSDRQPASQITWEDLFPGDFTESKKDVLHPCDGIGPCSSNDNKAQEETGQDLWHPLNTTRYNFPEGQGNFQRTRTHSSRMRTGRSLTVCRSLLPGGECLLLGGLSAPGGIPTCTEADTPSVNRITDACKNITLAQLRCGR